MMGASNNSDFFVTGICSCNTSIHAIHGNKHKRFVTELMYRTYCMPILQEQKSVTPKSRKKTIIGGSH
jgi:hypothetical protein